RVIPAAGQRARIGLYQPARLGVAVLQGHIGPAVVLLPGGQERAVLARVGRGIVPGVAEVHAVFYVGPHPGTGAGAVARPAVSAVVDRVHRGVAVVGVVGLALAEVEAALVAGDVGGHDRVQPVGLSAGGQIAGGVIPVAGTELVEVDPVRRLAADVHRQRLGGGTDVRPAGAGACVPAAATRAGSARRGRHVVGVGALVVQFGDGAGRASAERVLRRDVDTPAGRFQADVEVGRVGGTLDLVKRSVIGLEQRPGSAVGRLAR